MEQTKAAIRQFLERFIQGHDLQDDDDIFAMGYVKSMFAMQLVQFMEQTFAITVEDADLEMENYRSINAMADFVTRKGGG